MNPLYQLDKCGTSSVAPDSTLDNLNLANKICLISMGLNQKSSRVSDCVFVRLGIVVVGLLVLMTMVVSTTAESDRLNKTSLSGGLFWSTAKEETDLMHNSGQDDSSAASVVNDHEELDGGFSSLDGMLQWAIGHSDPQKLKETAQDVQRLSPSELKKRQMEIKELMDKLKTPSDAQLMQIAIDDLNNSSLSLEDHYRALQELLILVEPIDNANDLNKLGGLVVVIRDLEHPDTGIRTVSAWVIGKASQNNALVQNQVLELGALSKLMKMVKSTSVEEGIKAFYAISALIRNNVAGQEMFYAEAGDVMLQDILSNTSNDIRLQRKAVVLVSSLAESQLENVERYRVPFFSNQVFLKSVVDLITSYDLDLQEKALGATKNLLQLGTTEGAVFKGFCGLDGALERMRLQLKDLMLDEDHKDYATDLETLRQEVEFIFHRKLEKVIQVPT